MLQNILNVVGVQHLNKIQQKSVKGGFGLGSGNSNCSNAPECSGSLPHNTQYDGNGEVCCNIEST